MTQRNPEQRYAARLIGPGGAGDPTPLYFKLETVLRAAIETREYAQGENLPSERELGELYGVSRITVRKALEALEREGLVRRGRGRHGGTFVLDTSVKTSRSSIGSLDRVVSKQKISRIKVIAFEVRPCDPETAAVLSLQPDEKILYVERLMFTPDGPAAYVRNFLPLHIGEKLRRGELRTTLLVNALTRRVGIKIDEVQDEIEAYLAESRIATMLNIRPGSPVLRVRRVFVATGGERVNLTVLLIGSKYRMSATLHGEMFNSSKAAGAFDTARHRKRRSS